ncbi:MAG: hypothetical protein WCL27_00145, partial [Betaproteobacteria bacterium]
VADVYDALITKRVYKEAYPHDESIQMMLAERGSHFDPEIIDVLASIADKFEAIALRFKDVVEERYFRKRERRI